MSEESINREPEAIAIIGISCRFPGAANLEQFWHNLRNGVESITFWSEAELAAAGVDPATLANPRYVRARGCLEGYDLFAAAFFGFTPSEAAITDPQHRLFLECAWQALEHAGYDPLRSGEGTGVFAGAGLNTYALRNLLSNPELLAREGEYRFLIGNDKDFVATRTSYKLDLRGPSLNISTACSTSLVAVHYAANTLLSYQCDLALAGAVSIYNPQNQGYLHEPGGILSPDGHCRPFAAEAAGTVGGAGVGVVVLKRLSEALADGDTIQAVILASAVNNDGANKIGFTAPSEEGQFRVIVEAQELAGVEPESIGYLEAHGTGTALGDPIELAALTRAFRRPVQSKGITDPRLQPSVSTGANEDPSAKVQEDASEVVRKDINAEVRKDASKDASEINADPNAEVRGHGVPQVAASGTATRAQAREPARSPQDAVPRDRVRIGSVKSNIGHCDTAAGMAGLIKSVLALRHGEIPPTLHCQRINPEIDLLNSPFRVNSELESWERPDSTPRRAGVSSFGVGGTNAHLILEEPPRPPGSEAGLGSGPGSGPGLGSMSISAARSWQVLTLAAKTTPALKAMAANLADFLAAEPRLSLAEVAATLQLGRSHFTAQRRSVVCADLAGAIAALRGDDQQAGRAERQGENKPRIVFLFSGQGTQYSGMGAELYQREPVFRREFDRCAEILQPRLGQDLRRLIFAAAGDTATRYTAAADTATSYTAAGDTDTRNVAAGDTGAGDSGAGDPAAAALLNETGLAQPALFALEYSLAKLLMELGVEPRACLGHSLGEYVAATVAGIFSLESALKLVASRAALMQEMAKGAMLAVAAPFAELPAACRRGLALAAVNHPRSCVLSGPFDRVTAAEEELAKAGISSKRLRTSHAFHSEMMAPAARRFAREFAGISVNSPTIPVISNLTGKPLTAGEAADPDYWSRHLLNPVRFAEGVAALLAPGPSLALELGPGETLSRLARNCGGRGSEHQFLPLLPTAAAAAADHGFTFSSALARLWQAGATIAWAALEPEVPRRRIPLPGYPFERQRFLVEPAPAGGVGKGPDPVEQAEPSDWFYLPSWQRTALTAPAVSEENPSSWLIFADSFGVGEKLGAKLAATGAQVEYLYPAGPGPEGTAQRDQAEVSPHERTQLTVGGMATGGTATARSLDPADPASWQELFGRLAAGGKLPRAIIYAWSLTGVAPGLAVARALGYDALILLTRAWEQSAPGRPLQLTVLSAGMHEVLADETSAPEKSLLLGPVTVIPQEHPHIRCRAVDLALSGGRPQAEESELNQLLELAAHPTADPIIALRARQLWRRTFEAVPFPRQSPRPFILRPEGVYLLVGGLGGVGLQLAEYLARTVRARLVLVGRGTRRSAATAAQPVPRALRPGQAGLPDHGSDAAGRESGSPIGAFAPALDSHYLDRLREQMEQRCAIRGIQERPGLSEGLLALSAALVLRYFRQAGVEIVAGSSFSLAELEQKLAISPGYRRFFRLLLQILAEEGLAELTAEANVQPPPTCGRSAQLTDAGSAALDCLPESGALLNVGSPLPQPVVGTGGRLPVERILFREAVEQLAPADPAKLLAELSAGFPAFAPLARFLVHCADNYPEVLTGTTPALAVLYPRGEAAALHQLASQVEEHTFHRLYCTMLAQLVREAVASAGGKKVRILEIGGGAGILTKEVLPLLAECNVQYTFTDLGPSFVAQARRWAQAQGFATRSEPGVDRAGLQLIFGTLDVSRDGVAQGYPEAAYDLIIELDVVHATPRIVPTLTHLRRLLAPGGLLGLVESTVTPRWTSMIYGLAEGWWYYQDHELRREGPLLAPEQWQRVLGQAGFAEVEVQPGETSKRRAHECCLVIGRKPLEISDQGALAPVAIGSAYQGTDLKSVPDHEGSREEVARSSVAIDSGLEERLRLLEQLGGRVAVYRADISEQEQMAAVIAQVEAQWGPISGVIHTAASENRGAIQLKRVGEEGSEFAAKVTGTMVLDQLFAARSLDFMLLCTSITAILGGVGDVEYTAVNAFADAFARSRAGREGRWTAAIDWDRWIGTGMALAFEQRYRALSGSDPRGGMSPAQGQEAFARILSNPRFSQVVVSSRPLEGWIREARGGTVSAIAQRVTKLNEAAPRPQSAEKFVAPAGTTQTAIAEIWQEVLGLERVGAHDIFAEIGGDSLVAIKVAARLSESLGVTLSIRALFEHPSVAQLAEQIEALRALDHAGAEPGAAPGPEQEEESGTL